MDRGDVMEIEMKTVFEQITVIKQQYPQLLQEFLMEDEVAYFSVATSNFNNDTTCSSEGHIDKTGEGFKLTVGYELIEERTFIGIYNLTIQPDDISLEIGGWFWTFQEDRLNWIEILAALWALAQVSSDKYELLLDICFELGLENQGF